MGSTISCHKTCLFRQAISTRAYSKTVYKDIKNNLKNHYLTWSYTVPSHLDEHEIYYNVTSYLEKKLATHEAPVHLMEETRTIVIDMTDHIPDARSIVESHIIEILRIGQFRSPIQHVVHIPPPFKTLTVHSLIVSELEKRGLHTKWNVRGDYYLDLVDIYVMY